MEKELMMETRKLVVWTRDSLVTYIRMMELMLLVRTTRKDSFAVRIIISLWPLGHARIHD
jgi:hypothetical protein